jgi:hypothetical protein
MVVYQGKNILIIIKLILTSGISSKSISKSEYFFKSISFIQGAFKIVDSWSEKYSKPNIFIISKNL